MYIVLNACILLIYKAHRSHLFLLLVLLSLGIAFLNEYNNVAFNNGTFILLRQ